jgi:hypothetical protein
MSETNQPRFAAGIDPTRIRLAARRSAQLEPAGSALARGQAVGVGLGLLLGAVGEAGQQTAEVGPAADGSRLTRAIAAMQHQQAMLAGQAIRLEEIVSQLAGRLPDQPQPENRVRPANMAKLAQVEDLLSDHDDTIARIHRAIDALVDAVG